jgi:Flp pilus assembly protein TadB
MDFLTIANVDRLGAVATLIIVAVAVITDKLVWHTRLARATARADRWEQIALDALVASARAGVQAAETAVEVIASIPDPQGDRDKATAARKKGGHE